MLSYDATVSRCLVVSVFASCLCLALVGCATGEPAAVAQARGVFGEKIDEDVQYARYALSLVGGARFDDAEQLILRSITSAHQQVALQAMEALDEPLSADAVTALQTLFRERGGAVQRDAAVLLAANGDAEALEFVKGHIAETTGTLDLDAVVLLAGAGEQELLTGVLRRRMESDSSELRDEAYAVLGQLSRPWATALLLEGFERERGAERQGAIRALGLTGDPAVAEKIARFTNTQGLVFTTLEALGAVGNASVAARLEKQGAHDEPLVRVFAGAALWRLGDGAAGMAVLEPLSTHEDPTVRRNVAEQLSEIHAAEAVPLLEVLARDAEGAVQIAALHALSERESDALANLYLDLSSVANYEVSTLALDGLARLGAWDAVESLQPLLASENPYVAIAAAHAILNIHARDPGAAGSA
ncbi:MAG: HEAT repeat domain-containing protein [bacterium]|nr:HEAT repeat domain-containing protein [bacterium]